MFQKIKLSMLLVLILIASHITAQGLDIKLLEKINIHRNKSYDPFFKTITNSSKVISLASPVLVLTTGLIHKNKAILHQGYYLLSAQVLNAILTQGIKSIVKRPRPVIDYPQIQAESNSMLSYSFPSGHTSSAFNTATALSLTYKKWYIVAPAYTYAMLMGYSRMHLGVHYPSDVLAGAILGAGSAWLCKRIEKKYFTKKPKASI